MEVYRISPDYISGLVSIIIPTHNRENLITETIESVFSQIYDKIELIIIDDNSTDNTECIILENKKKSKLFDFKYIKSNKRGGQAARNIGLTHSRGEFIQFFDDDDIMSPDHIQKKVNVLLENNEVGYVASNYFYFEETFDNIVSCKNVHDVCHTVESHILSNSFPTPIFMCRRSSILEIGFWNERIGRLQDLTYFHRLFLKNIKGLYISDYLFKVRKHAKSITSNTSLKILKDKVLAYNTVYNEFHQAGKKTRLLGDVLFICKMGCFVEAIKFKYYYWALCNFLGLVITNPIRTGRLTLIRIYYNYVGKERKNFYKIFFN